MTMKERIKISKNFFVLVCIMIVSLIFNCNTVYASKKVVDGITYEFSYGEEDVLRISGNGTIKNMINYNLDEIDMVVIGEGITSIPDSAFSGCHELSKVIIPSTMQKIGDSAFAYTGITSVELPSSCIEIGNKAFYNTKIKTVSMSNGLKMIGEQAFSYCCELLEVTIPESVTTIGRWAFSDCDKLAKIIIPNTLTIIGANVFSDCDGLLEIVIPDGVTTIDSHAFSYCDQLMKVVIPDSVTAINKEAFYNCIKLREITIPDSVTIIGNYAFGYKDKDYVEGDGKGGAEKVKTSIFNINGKIGSEAERYALDNEFYFNGKDTKICIHSYNKVISKASMNKQGSITEKCSKCGNVKKTTVIPAPTKISLSAYTHTYSGKERKPSVIIYDTKGRKLSKKRSYSVSYKHNKYVGKAMITITFKGNYKGKVIERFPIVPKSTTVKSLQGKEKAFIVSWAKVNSQVSGYQIQYSTSKSFPKKQTKIATLENNSTFSKTLSTVKSTTYYVRVRVFKRAESGTYYSKWSETKSVKTY